MRARLLTATLVLLSGALLVTGATAGNKKRTLQPNPANHPALIDKRMDPNRYDGAGAGCAKRAKKGTRKLKRWLKRSTKRKVWSGTIRCDGGLHSTGRALDFALDARKKRQKRLAMRVIRTWTARDEKGRRNALARRMGVQLVIYNCRWWQAGDREMQRYSACSDGRKNADPTQGHIDHIHVELTKPAAKLRTSFWKTDLKGGSGDGGSGGIGRRG